MFCLAEDFSDYYVIPVEHKAEFKEWVDALWAYYHPGRTCQDPAPEGPPDWAKRIDGPYSIEFLTRAAVEAAIEETRNLYDQDSPFCAGARDACAGILSRLFK